MRRVLQQKRCTWLPAMVAVLALGTGVDWSAGGSDTGTINLQVDEAYYDTPLPDMSVPSAVESADAMSMDGPRAKAGLVSVLVYMEPMFTRNAVERADVRSFAALNKGKVHYEYGDTMPNVLNLRDIPEDQVDALRNMPGVVKVEKDEYHPNVLKLHDSIPLIRGLQSQITGAGLSADGAGVRICVVDTGIDSDHVMYSDRIDTSKGYDFYNDDNNPEDDNGHGSHCSGIALGGTGISWDPCGTGSMPFQGVAPEATLIGCKVLNFAGGGYDSDIIAGIDYCADQSASGAQADVISMSIGTGNYSGPCTHSWAVAANNAVANGVVAVAASGNENYSNAMGSPACGVDVIAVGMTWKNDYPTCEDPTTNWNWGICTDYAPQTDDVGCFSNESDYLDVTAPGANIWSASTAAGGASITGMSGTSMSCPTVAGLVALVLDVDPTLTPAEVRQIIRDGAIDMGPAGFDRAYGYGRIDVINTLNLLAPCTGDPDCDDGLFCNGAETCVSQSCQAGSDPCPGQSCDEVNDQCVEAPTVQYEWTMNTNPGWSVEGLWAWGQPTGGGGQYGGPDPTSGYTGTNVYGYNLSGDYENSLPETHLTTTAIDCTDLVEVSVTFQRWLGVEVNTYDHAYFRVSNNGSTWTTVWQNSAQVADTAWTLQEFDISAIADNQPTVYLRWTMGTTDTSWQFCGWNIDDVQIWGRNTGTATCSDGIQNQGEDRIDCGGPCPACECTNDAACSDGAYCNGVETCDAYGDCQSGTAVDCNDAVGCTDDSCNEGTDSCDNIAIDANCDNGLYCDGAETCHATLDCQSGTSVNCNDGVGCTDDSCNEGTDSCDNVANDANCDNGLYCDGAETCHATLDCQSGTAVDCNDGVGCTDDSCNEGTDSCDNLTNDANCDNGLYCDGAEWCHATSDCQAGTTVDCNDGVGCTNDSCNEGTDSCDNIADDGNCDNGLFCDGTETCHATLDCRAGSDPCPGQLCDEGGDFCYDCGGDPDCDDGVYCNGAETCVGGTCQAGTAVDCNDGVGCTDDSCNEGTDSCDNIANNANCDNGLYCDGAETCHTTLDCQSGSAVDCNDAVGCTDDSCNEGTDSCDNIANDANCDNGLYCDGTEICHATLDCRSGTAIDCSDGVGCTDDSCNEGTDSCDNVANDTNCPDDGLFCNGTESCDPVSDCVSSGDPCAPQYCNETTDQCEAAECAVPADCDDSSDCTVDDCIDGVCYNDCSTEVSTFPYTEGFESGWGDWGNVGGDDMDWTRDSGGTPSSSTGPSAAHGGTWYVYTEASSPNYPSKTAILEGPCFDFTGASDADLTFWYHMYGTAMGTLNLEVSEDCVTWDTVWSLSGNQGNSWYQASVDLSAYALQKVKMRWRGVTGSSYTSDMTIDDLSLTITPAVTCGGDPECDDGLFCNGAETCAGGFCQPGTYPCPMQGCDEASDVCIPCTENGQCDDGNDCTVDTCVSGVCYNDCATQISSFPYSEGYESGWGDWVNVGGDAMDWTRNTGSTSSSSTGPSGAHGGTYYVYTEASSPNYPNVTGIIEGPCFDFTGASAAEMTFWYHMYGAAMGTLYVEVSEDCVDWAEVWSLSGNQGDTWYQAAVDLSAYDGTLIKIRFRGVTGTSYTSDICVDDVAMTASAGPECGVPADCDDGLYCNGVEDCVSGSCVDGTAVDCGDGVACTDDSCNEGTDSCDNVPDNANCDNGAYCDGAETCDEVLGCQAGTTVDCNDGVGCTDDSCNEGTDSCDNVPNDAYCDNGAFCDGAEVCNATLDCQGGSDPCPGQYCDEGGDSCYDCETNPECDDGLFCNGAETCVGGFCQAGSDPCPGQGCDEVNDECLTGPVAQMEGGTVSVGASYVTVNLTNTYVNPVVVCSAEYANNTTPVVTRISSVTSTSFDIRLQNPSGGAVAAEDVSCLVVEEGAWTIDGVDIEAQTYLSTVTDENNSWVGETQTYGNTYTNPVVIGQVMSENDPLWSVFWCQGTFRTNPPSASALKTGKEVAEDTNTTRADETVGFIVFEAGHGTIGGVAFEALVGADTVRGITNGPPFTYTFNTAFASVPTMAVTTLAGVDGGNGGWSYTYGANPTTATTLDVVIDEDQIGDIERNHTTEQVGYVVFETAFVYP
ncbi:MAG: S8 family serine peptidase [Phycisphaerales bacterium]|nr:MAG: S8 family serine peptidase [Phycisphaerales bacterium]